MTTDRQRLYNALDEIDELRTDVSYWKEVADERLAEARRLRRLLLEVPVHQLAAINEQIHEASRPV